MKRIFLNVFACFFIVAALFSCGVPIIKKDYLYIPVVRAQSGTGYAGNADYADNTASFQNMENQSTIAFYKGEGDTGFKKFAANELMVYGVNRLDLVKFHPNKEELLLMKTAISPGHDYSAYVLANYTEFAVPNDYYKNIDLNIADIKNGRMNMEYALIAINVGNSPLRELKIIDVLPAGVSYVGSKYATKDDFVPLNVDLAPVGAVKHSIVKNGDKTILIFDVDEPNGIKPAKMVEIVVNVEIAVPSNKK
jgi:hypothetical protein